ncbi:hypothetical protein FAUST_10524 [Fusarium austroamericanum]|uniref:Cytochrome P450 n=1 Tax=Fusarium austroamericanum TaxID=282268 RepID=A0AAN5Z0M0_FUSAU|nr:hypothetical protein FAUST_10524 [Fusarium austroamericanum]
MITKCPFSNPNSLFQDLATVRQTDGIEYNEKLKGYLVTRFDDIVDVLNRPDEFSSRPTVPDFPPPVKPLFKDKVPEKGTLLAWDNPDHDRLRKSVASFFVPRRLKRFEPMLHVAANELIDSFIDKGTVDMKSAFALPLPLRSIVTIAGLDPERWQWIGQCLTLFGGIARRDDEEEVSIQQKIQDVLDLHEYIRQVIEERRLDRRDDLISHIWNERDAGTVVMTDFEHLSMIPGLLLAGHETTTNVLTMGLAHILHNGLWEQISQNDETRKAAIEELLRFESAITGMPRQVTSDGVQLCGMKLNAGDRLFVAYNSGSRDESKFENPNKLDMSRQSKTQHLGFGRGVHACLGAPFARLLLRTELAVLYTRLPNLRLVTPYEKLAYGEVHEARSIGATFYAWDIPSPGTERKVHAISNGNAACRSAAVQNIPMVVRSLENVAHNVIQISLQLKDTTKQVKWTPGAHVDISVGNLGFRQYSVCSDPMDTKQLKITVLREDQGTGGSRYLHENLKLGDEISIRGPRNNFKFAPGTRRTILIAGGIGITPMIPMAEEVAVSGIDYKIIYLGRSRAGMAYIDKITQRHGERAVIWVTEEHGGARLELSKLLQAEDHTGLRVYCCGPESLLTTVEENMSHAPLGTVHVERFANPVSPLSSSNTAFDVLMAKSGRVLHVPEDKTVLEVINEAGGNVLSTCNKGLCGTCEVGVLEGTPEHRDVVLTAAERAENSSLMTCVSRCRGKSLVLDLW